MQGAAGAARSPSTASSLKPCTLAGPMCAPPRVAPLCAGLRFTPEQTAPLVSACRITACFSPDAALVALDRCQALTLGAMPQFRATLPRTS
jgi:hypothetical protein